MAAKTNSAVDKEQILSTLLGMAVVVVVGILVYRYFQNPEKNKGEIDGGELTEQEALEQEELQPTAELQKYTVKANDNLWKIAEIYYKSGYNWIDIAKANNLGNPDLINVGQTLVIPDVAPKQPTVLVQDQEESITTGEKYTIQKGDWLSKIALRAYGDMFAWEKIYEANKQVIGPNPHYLKEGTTIVIPE